jgi:hypothetical protein
MANLPRYFKGPAEFAIYGGPPNGAILRVSGAETIEAAEEIIFTHRKSYPDWTYSIWQAIGGWKEVKPDL